MSTSQTEFDLFDSQPQIKAFDTRDHQILLRKLQCYGIRGIACDWFKSYLENRLQYVSYNTKDSDYMKIMCGVPQGSILGPLLFIYK